ncbi:MAG: type secretion system family protein [Rhodoglobus sp.]|nr:type secretion system family protein [Rhodoglobus sp.]
MSLIVILACVAVAGGIAAVVGILIGGGRQRTAPAVTPMPDGPPAAPSPKAKRAGGEALTGALPKGYIGMIERNIMLAGRPVGWTVDKIILAKPMLAVPIALAAYWFASMDPVPLRIGLGIFSTLLAFFVPELLIWSRALERQEKIQLALPDTLDQMTISVEAGLGFEAAMAKAGQNGSGPLAEELIRTLQDMSIGRTRRDAYEALAARTSSVDLRRFTRAVTQADIYGIAIADVLRVQASEMRLKRRQRAEEKAMQVPVKVIFPLIFCILPVLFIVLLTPAGISIFEAFF